MRYIIMVVIGLLFVTKLVFFSNEVEAVDNVKDKAMFSFASDDNAKFASKLLSYEFMNKSENFVISPLSVYSLSVLMANGLTGQSLQELSTFLNVTDLNAVNEKLGKYINDNKASVQINNSIWGNNFSDEYKDLLEDKLDAEAGELKGNVDPINKWINKKTKGQFNNIISPRSVSDNDLFLVNTVYFNNKWKSAFDKKKTKDDTFYDINGNQSIVEMMHGEKVVDYYENDELQAIRLYYRKSGYMTIFLPKEGVDFKEFVKTYDFSSFSGTNEMVDIYLPKFEISASISDTKEMYESFGIKSIFSDSEDFYPMLENKYLVHVNEIVLKAKIKVDEKETVAVAASFMSATDAGLPFDEPEEPIFRADRPFVFMINEGDFIGAYIKGEKN